jgi:hypothetical protein
VAGVSGRAERCPRTRVHPLGGRITGVARIRGPLGEVIAQQSHRLREQPRDVHLRDTHCAGDLTLCPLLPEPEPDDLPEPVGQPGQRLLQHHQVGPQLVRVGGIGERAPRLGQELHRQRPVGPGRQLGLANLGLVGADRVGEFGRAGRTPQPLSQAFGRHGEVEPQLLQAAGRPYAPGLVAEVVAQRAQDRRHRVGHEARTGARPVAVDRLDQRHRRHLAKVLGGLSGPAVAGRQPHGQRQGGLDHLLPDPPARRAARRQRGELGQQRVHVVLVDQGRGRVDQGRGRNRRGHGSTPRGRRPEVTDRPAMLVGPVCARVMSAGGRVMAALVRPPAGAGPHPKNANPVASTTHGEPFRLARQGYAGAVDGHREDRGGRAMSGGGGPRRRGPASRLPAHRAVLALGLLAAGPPLILHDGWRGAIPAAGAAGYAVYLIAGKRWPLPRRRSRPPGKAGPQPARTSTAGSPVEGPAAESTAIEGTAGDGPAAESTAIEGTAVEGTAVEGTAVESTAVEGSAVESRAVEAPATERPVADGPAVEGPVVEGPVVEGPGVDGPGAAPEVVSPPEGRAPRAGERRDPGPHR